MALSKSSLATALASFQWLWKKITVFGFWLFGFCGLFDIIFFFKDTVSPRVQEEQSSEHVHGRDNLA